MKHDPWLKYTRDFFRPLGTNLKERMLDVRSEVVSKEVEVTTIEIKKETVVTLVLSEREAKALGCLIGAMAPADAEKIIERSMDFERWLDSRLEDREIIRLTGDLYDGIYETFL